MILRVRHSAEQGPYHHGMIPGDHPEFAVRVIDPGRLRDDRYVGHDRHGQTRAGRRSAYRRHDRLVAIDDIVDDAASFRPTLHDAVEVGPEIADAVRVTAGAEGVARSADDRGMH